MGLTWLGLAALGALGFATMGRSLREVSHSEVEALAEKKRKPERAAQIFRDENASTACDLWTSLFVLFIGVALANANWSTAEARLATGVFVVLATLFVLPPVIAGIAGTPLVFYSWPAFRAVNLLSFPVLWLAKALGRGVSLLLGRPGEKPSEEVFEDEVRVMMAQGSREGLLEDDAKDMIVSVMQLDDVPVAQIMTPRTDMFCLSANIGWEEALSEIIESGHTRVPVYGKGRDDIVGVLYTKDVLRELVEHGRPIQRPLSSFLREPFFVPESKRVDTLLEEFQLLRNHIAIVLDEFGGVCGLVTIEDVLEEIVGEIQDEYDEEFKDGFKVLPDGGIELRGRSKAAEVCERFKIELDADEETETIGGLVFHRLGHVPKAGETLRMGRALFTVLETTRRRIERLRIDIDAETGAETTTES